MANKSDSKQDKNKNKVKSTPHDDNNDHQKDSQSDSLVANYEDTQESNVFRDFIQEAENFKALTDHKYNPYDDLKVQPTQQNNNTPKEHHYPLGSESSSGSDLHYPLSSHIWRPEVSADDYLFYFQHGVQHKTIRKLRAGKMRIEASLDLHQMNKEQARIEFSKFVQHCYQREMRCICIIHGKGLRSGGTAPILKNLVNHWLYDIDIVLGFCSCPSHMGGTGAIMVLLQRYTD